MAMLKRVISIRRLLLALFIAAGGLLAAGVSCNNPGGSGGNLLGLGQKKGDRWTIRCVRISGRGHAQQAEALAQALRQVPQLRAKDVRVVADDQGSTIYYGEYYKVASPTTGLLAFPEQYQRDIELIRSLSYNRTSTPFFTAQPELMDSGPVLGHPEWDVMNAQGTHTLMIGVFYNTPTFSQRRETAEEYVKLLRDEGFKAYYYHEPVKSFVFVGDFTADDIVRTPEGPRFGPRVEQLIARREEEFRHFTENGHQLNYRAADGRMVPALSELVPLPRHDKPVSEAGPVFPE